MSTSQQAHAHRLFPIASLDTSPCMSLVYDSLSFSLHDLHVLLSPQLTPIWHSTMVPRVATDAPWFPAFGVIASQTDPVIHLLKVDGNHSDVNS